MLNNFDVSQRPSGKGLHVKEDTKYHIEKNIVVTIYIFRLFKKLMSYFFH